jgi:hypothetical protein
MPRIFTNVKSKTCLACGSEFETGYSQKTYCTKECYLNFWYDRLGGRKKISNHKANARLRNPEKTKRDRRAEWLKRAYGITVEQYNNLFELQEGCCALCGVAPEDKPFHGLHVDHDHLTGKIRGLLCRWCNSMLGRVEAYPSWLVKAEEYLEKEGAI